MYKRKTPKISKCNILLKVYAQFNNKDIIINADEVASYLQINEYYDIERLLYCKNVGIM